MNIEESGSPDSVRNKRNLKIRIKSLYSDIKRIICQIAEKSWKGAAIGSLLALIFLIAAYSIQVRTGISPVIDMILIILLMALSVFGIGALAKMPFGNVRQFNPYYVTAITGSFIVATFLPGQFFTFSFIFIEMLCGAMLSFSIYNGIRKKSSIFFFILALVLNAVLAAFLYWDGLDKTVAVNNRYWNQLRETPVLKDPSLPGACRVKTLNYGSGTDKNREAYGKNVDLKTKSVNADAFFKQTSGFDNYFREIYWGFNSKNYPINARVWYPEGIGPFPLVLVVHGNHIMTENSDAGYEYLGKLLASRGFIVASIDENFLNVSWFDDYQQNEVFTRAWLILKHLENWRNWNQTKSNPFYKKVDMDNIVLIGHSRGGAAVAVASVINKLKKYHLDAGQEFNFNFSVKGIIQIAPNDPYTPQTEVQLKPENIDYLVLQGGYDLDINRFLGNRVYNRLSFTDGKAHFKSALYIYRANHGQFNTKWGKIDLGFPFSWLINSKPIMPANEQRKIAEIYISAFLEVSLHGKTEYSLLFKDYRNAFPVLPKEYYFNQYEDSDFKFIADFEEDFDVNTASVNGCTIEGKHLKKWSENAITLRDEWNTSQQNCGVYLAWNYRKLSDKDTAQYTIIISDSVCKGLITKSTKSLYFSVCRMDKNSEALDFTIELIGKNASTKKSFREFFDLPPVLSTKISKWNFIYNPAKGKTVENVLQYIELPFSEFTKQNKFFKPTELTGIRFLFDKTGSGEIFLDKIGIGCSNPKGFAIGKNT